MPAARMTYHLRVQADASPITKAAQRTTANITTHPAYAQKAYGAVLAGRSAQRSIASCRARVETGPLALAGIASAMAGHRAVGQERFVLRDRRRRTPAAVRPAGRAERARGARGRTRDCDRADRAVA